MGSLKYFHSLFFLYRTLKNNSILQPQVTIWAVLRKGVWWLDVVYSRFVTLQHTYQGHVTCTAKMCTTNRFGICHYVAHYYRLQQHVRHTCTGAAHFTFSYLMSSHKQLVFKWVLMDYVYVVQVKFYKNDWLAVLIIYGQRGYQIMNHKFKWFDLWDMTRPWYLW